MRAWNIDVVSLAVRRGLGMLDFVNEFRAWGFRSELDGRCGLLGVIENTADVRLRKHACPMRGRTGLACLKCA